MKNRLRIWVKVGPTRVRILKVDVRDSEVQGIHEAFTFLNREVNGFDKVIEYEIKRVKV